MGVGAAIFESAGQRTEHYVPGVYSRSNNVSSPSGVSAGNHVILAKSIGGKPFELLSFGSLSDAKDVLVGGDLLNAIGYAFKGSNVYTPQTVYAMRVGKANQAECILKSGGINLIKLKAWDYGSHCNQLKIMIESGNEDDTSRTIRVVYKDKSIEVADIKRESFQLEYIGESTNPVCTITNSGITLNTDSESDNFTCTWEDAPTLSDLEVRINNSGVWICTVIDTASDRKCAELDTISNESVNPTVFTSTLQAIIEELINIPLIGSVELLAQNSRIIPEITSNYIYFTGGSADPVTVADYEEALSKLELEDIQIISTPSTDADVHSLISAHCTQMSSTVNRKERTCILGAGIGETDEAGLASARGFNSKYVSYVIDSAIANNPLTGAAETISGAMVGVMLAGMESAMAVNLPLTFKTLNVLGFTKKRTISNMEKLIKGGLLVCQPNPENIAEFIVIRGLTTYQGNNDLISCERSMVREDLYMNRDLRNQFSSSIGGLNGSDESTIISTLKQAAKGWGASGYIIKGSDWVWDIKVRFDGDKVYLSFSRYLNAPRNFVFITATNHVYNSEIEL